MADAVTSQVLIDGPTKLIMKFTNISDSTGESAVTKVDVSALTPAASRVSIEKIFYDVQGLKVQLLWDADTDVVAYILVQGMDTKDFKEFGGLINNAGTGVTGDIKFTTIGHSNNDIYSIILVMRKTLV